MERSRIYNLERYLPMNAAAEILQVRFGKLSQMVANGIIQPLRDQCIENSNLWGSQEILRGFFALRLIAEYRQKYGKSQVGYEADQVKSDLLRTIRTQGPEVFKSEEWRVVVKRAAKRGIFFKESLL
jgi:hypothetical protein